MGNVTFRRSYRVVLGVASWCSVSVQSYLNAPAFRSTRGFTRDETVSGEVSLTCACSMTIALMEETIRRLDSWQSYAQSPAPRAQGLGCRTPGSRPSTRSSRMLGALSRNLCVVALGGAQCQVADSTLLRSGAASALPCTLRGGATPGAFLITPGHRRPHPTV